MTNSPISAPQWSDHEILEAARGAYEKRERKQRALFRSRKKKIFAEDEDE